MQWKFYRRKINNQNNYGLQNNKSLKLGIRLEFEQYYVFLIKQGSVLTIIMSSFGGENMEAQYEEICNTT